MLNCFIIDDEKHAIALLTGYINQTPGIKLSGSTTDPIMGLSEVQLTKPDVLFLDVDMPNLNGLELFRLLNQKIDVIITTAFDNYAVSAFDISSSDFLLKPIRYDRFLQSVGKIMHRPELDYSPRFKQDKEFVFVQSGAKSKIVKLRFNDIFFIESLHNYLIIHTVNDRHIVYLSLKELHENLPADLFIRIHKSYIINYAHIDSITGHQIMGKDIPTLTIGNQYKEDFFKKVQQHMLKKK